MALLARQWGNVLQAGLSIASIVYGSLLGVFLLGLLTRRVGEIAAMCGMSVGLVLLLYVRFATPIAFTWYVMIGASATFATAVLVSLVYKEAKADLIPRPDRVAHWDCPGRCAVWWWSDRDRQRHLSGAVAMMIRAVGSTPMVLAVWVFGGILTMFGALSYAELSAAMPGSGAEYVYLNAAYGPFLGFIYGWTLTWVARPGRSQRWPAEFIPTWPTFIQD